MLLAWTSSCVWVSKGVAKLLVRVSMRVSSSSASKRRRRRAGVRGKGGASWAAVGRVACRRAEAWRVGENVGLDEDDADEGGDEDDWGR